jgi:gliding motility-associated-like protein
MWPYNTSACDDIINDVLPPVRCNWNSPCENFTGVADNLPPGGSPGNFEPGLPVVAGEQYLICLSNYSSQSTNLPLNFFGSADVSCTSVLIVDADNVTICPGDDATLTASVPGSTGTITYDWEPGSLTGSSITVSPGTTTVYTVTATEDLGSGIMATGTTDVTVTVLPANDPLCSCTVDASNTGPVCFNATFDLNATTVSNATYVWDIGGVQIGTGQNLSNIPALAPGTYSVQVTATDDNGFICTDLTQLTIIPSSDPNCACEVSASNSGPLCENGNFNLTSTTVINGSYQWDMDGSIIGSEQNLTNLPAYPAGDVMFYLTATDENGFICIDSTEVTFNPLPNVSAGIDQSICHGSIASLNASGAQTYSWFDGNQWLPPSGQSNMDFVPTSNTTYMVLGTDINNCENTDTLDVNMIMAQLPNVGPLNNIGCAPFSVELNNNVVDAQSCQWIFSNNLSSTSCGTQNFIFPESGCFDLTINMVDVNGCDSSMTYPDIVCVEGVEASFTVSPNTIGPENSSINFSNGSVGAEDFIWSYGDGSSSIDFEGSHQYDPNSQDGYIVSLVAISPSGCIDSASMVIAYQEQLIYYVPNSFTPDSDEHNQLFKPVFTSGFDPYNFEMTIFNRWGEMIWKTQDHQSGWDGSYGKSDGLPVQAGMYTWVIKFKPKDNDEKVIISGSINVLK